MLALFLFFLSLFVRSSPGRKGSGSALEGYVSESESYETVNKDKRNVEIMGSTVIQVWKKCG